MDNPRTLDELIDQRVSEQLRAVAPGTDAASMVMGAPTAGRRYDADKVAFAVSRAVDDNLSTQLPISGLVERATVINGGTVQDITVADMVGPLGVQALPLGVDDVWAHAPLTRLLGRQVESPDIWKAPHWPAGNIAGKVADVADSKPQLPSNGLTLTADALVPAMFGCTLNFSAWALSESAQSGQIDTYIDWMLAQTLAAFDREIATVIDGAAGAAAADLGAALDAFASPFRPGVIAGSLGDLSKMDVVALQALGLALVPTSDLGGTTIVDPSAVVAIHTEPLVMVQVEPERAGVYLVGVALRGAVAVQAGGLSVAP